MSINVYDDLVQGTPEWLQARAGVITASVVKDLVKTVRPRKTKTDPNPVTYLALADGDTATTVLKELAVQSVTGIVEETPSTWAMRRGTFLEPHARFDYSMNHAAVTETGFITRDLNDGHILGYSPDGLVGDDGLIEIKCMNARRHNDVHLTGAPNPDHVGQLQTGLWVTGRDWIDYVAFHPGYATAVVRVFPDPEWQSILDRVAVECNTRIADFASVYATATKDLPVAPHIELDF